MINDGKIKVKIKEAKHKQQCLSQRGECKKSTSSSLFNGTQNSFAFICTICIKENIQQRIKAIETIINKTVNKGTHRRSYEYNYICKTVGITTTKQIKGVNNRHLSYVHTKAVIYKRLEQQKQQKFNSNNNTTKTKAHHILHFT